MAVRWNAELDGILREHFPSRPTAEVADLIPGASYGAIATRASALGLRKTRTYRRAYLKGNRAAAIEAVTGSTPWNKKPPAQKVCESCGGSFEVPSYRRDTARFCSVDCLNEWKRTIRGERHPLFSREEATCQWCEEPFEVKRCHAEDPGRGIYCSSACLGSASTAAQGGRPSSIEEAVAVELDRRGVAYERQRRIGRWLCDFYLPDSNTVVECDGTYWHSRPEVVERDARKTAYLTGRGFRLVRLPEEEINADAASAVLRVLRGERPERA